MESSLWLWEIFPHDPLRLASFSLVTTVLSRAELMSVRRVSKPPANQIDQNPGCLIMILNSAIVDIVVI